jgi:hypothetical protein
MTQVPVLIGLPMRTFKSVEESIPAHIRTALAEAVGDPQSLWEFTTMPMWGGNVARNRNAVVAEFLRGNWKWLVFTDDDLPWTWDQLKRLLMHRKHIVGALYCRKQEGGGWVLNAYREPQIDEAGLLQVAELGTGLKVYHRSVFETLVQRCPEIEYQSDTREQEWGFFQMGVVEVDGRKRWLPEDYWLDQLCRRNGIAVHADTTIRLRHYDANGESWPKGEFPPLPGPKPQMGPPPVLAEDLPAPAEPIPGRIVLMLQYWGGDRDKAMRLAERISRSQLPVGTELCLVRRFDCIDDLEAIGRMQGHQLKISRHSSPIHVPGYPSSPNVMALDAIKHAGTNPAWADVKFFMLMEHDCVPMNATWLQSLADDWDRAASDGALILGSWRGESHILGHVNGNMLFSRELWHRMEADGADLPPPGRAWDIHYPKWFSKYWARTGLIANRYHERLLSKQSLETPECGTRAPVLTHGVSDDSAENLARLNWP